MDSYRYDLKVILTGSFVIHHDVLLVRISQEEFSELPITSNKPKQQREQHCAVKRASFSLENTALPLVYPHCQVSGAKVGTQICKKKVVIS